MESKGSFDSGSSAEFVGANWHVGGDETNEIPWKNANSTYQIHS